MGHSLRSMLEMSVACLIFVIAATAGLLLFQSGATALEATFVASRGTDHNVHTTLTPLAGDGTVSGTDVLHSIGSIGVDVVVDGTVYTAALEREQADLTAIQATKRYSMAWQRGSQGELVRVLFTSL
ncbi:hypothetical protein [Paenibacillus sp. S150]|uniref:hypothetical protein n=1 Tax=Paenibacillus sp. S150 TaxID=2749826 RepID=UPI001C57300E|nr:hypothetical protein [Paenibacillus sp. S150]MBW4081308.1 hypothetical protein [Paenibacillus sp. S150]